VIRSLFELILIHLTMPVSTSDFAPHGHLVEYAKSSGDKCASCECGQKIVEGEVRIGTFNMDKGVDMSVLNPKVESWRHMKCFSAVTASLCTSTTIWKGIENLNAEDKAKFDSHMAELHRPPPIVGEALPLPGIGAPSQPLKPVWPMAISRDDLPDGIKDDTGKLPPAKENPLPDKQAASIQKQLEGTMDGEGTTMGMHMMQNLGAAPGSTADVISNMAQAAGTVDVLKGSSDFAAAISNPTLAM